MPTEQERTQFSGAADGTEHSARLFDTLLPLLVAAAVLAVTIPAVRQLGGLLWLIYLGAAAVGASLALHPLVPFTLYYGVLFFADTVIPGFGISANQVLAFLFFGSFASYWARGRSLRLESTFFPVLGVAALYFACSAAFGENTERGLLHLRYVIIYFVLALALAKSLSAERALLGLAWIVVGTTFLASCAGFAEAVEKNVMSGFAGRWTSEVRIKGTAKNSIVYGWNLVYAVPFAFLLYSESRRHHTRILALALGLTACAAASLTFNRQTYLVIVLEIALCAFLFRYPNRRALLLAVGALGLTGALTVFPMILKRLLTVTTLSNDASFLERRDSYLMGMEMFQRHPLFGVGLGSFPAVWKQYIPADYPTYYVQYQEATRLRYPDFGYLALLSETGLVGLTLFLALLGVGFRHAMLLRQASLSTGDHFAANFASMVIALLAYVATTTLIQDSFLYTRVWILFALILLCDGRMWRR